MTNLLWKLVFQPLSDRVYVNLLEGKSNYIQFMPTILDGFHLSQNHTKPMLFPMV